MEANQSFLTNVFSGRSFSIGAEPTESGSVTTYENTMSDQQVGQTFYDDSVAIGQKAATTYHMAKAEINTATVNAYEKLGVTDIAKERGLAPYEKNDDGPQFSF